MFPAPWVEGWHAIRRTGLLANMGILLRPRCITTDQFVHFQFRFFKGKYLFWNAESQSTDYNHFDKSSKSCQTGCQLGRPISSAMTIFSFSSVKSKLFKT